MAVPKINFSRLRPIRGVSQVPQSLREPTCSDRSYHGRRCQRHRSSSTLESPPACACPRCMNGTRSLSTARCAPVRCGRLSIEKFPDMARAAPDAGRAQPRTATTSGRPNGGACARPSNLPGCPLSSCSSRAPISGNQATCQTSLLPSWDFCRRASNAPCVRYRVSAAFTFAGGATAASTSTGGSSRARRASPSLSAASRRSGTTSSRRCRNQSGASTLLWSPERSKRRLSAPGHSGDDRDLVFRLNLRPQPRTESHVLVVQVHVDELTKLALVVEQAVFETGIARVQRLDGGGEVHRLDVDGGLAVR